jgi:hypothetical protein
MMNQRISISDRVFEASMVIGVLVGLGMLMLATFLSNDPIHETLTIVCYVLSGAFMAYTPIALVIWAVMRKPVSPSEQSLESERV